MKFWILLNNGIFINFNSYRPCQRNVGTTLVSLVNFSDIVVWQLVFRMQFAVCNSRLNSQLHSRMQFAF